MMKRYPELDRFEVPSQTGRPVEAHEEVNAQMSAWFSRDAKKKNVRSWQNASQVWDQLMADALRAVPDDPDLS